jgi:hypothetical protein
MAALLSSFLGPVATAGVTGYALSDKISEYLERTLGKYIDVGDSEIEKSKTFSEFLNYLDIKQISPEYLKNLITDEVDYTFTIINNSLNIEYKTSYSEDDPKNISISPTCEINNDPNNNNNTKEAFLELFEKITKNVLKNVTFKISKDMFVNAFQNILIPLSNLMSIYIASPINLNIIVDGALDSEFEFESEQLNESFKCFFNSFKNINKLKIIGLKLNNYNEIIKCINSIKSIEEIEIIECNSLTIHERQPNLYDCLIPFNPTVKKISMIDSLTNYSIYTFRAEIIKRYCFNCKTLKIKGVRELDIDQRNELINFINNIGNITEIDIHSEDIKFVNFISILNSNKYEKINYFTIFNELNVSLENNQRLMTALNGCSKLKEFSIKITTPPADAPANKNINEKFLLILFNLSIEKLEIEVNGYNYGFDNENWKNILEAIGSNNFIRKLKISKLFSSDPQLNLNDFISQNFEINEGLVELELSKNLALNDTLIANLDEQIKLLPNLKKLLINNNINITRYLNELNELTHLSVNTATINERVGFIKNFNKEFNSSILSVNSRKDLCNNSLDILEAYTIEYSVYNVLLFCNKIYSIVIHEKLEHIADNADAIDAIKVINPNYFSKNNFFVNNKSLIKLNWKNNNYINMAVANSLVNFYLNCNKIYLSFINEVPSMDELVLYNIKKNKDNKYFRTDANNEKHWNYVNISNYLKNAFSKQQYMRYLNQTYDIVTYRLRWGGIYEDDNGDLWYQNGLDVPVQRYNKIVYNAYKKVQNFVNDWREGKAHPPYLIFNRADVNRKLGIITYEDPKDTEISLKTQKDLNAASGNALSQKRKFSDHSVNLLPAMVLQGGFDYAWTQVKF